MKRILKTIASIAMTVGALCACNDFDTLRGDVDNLESRVSSLEGLAREANGNIQALWSAIGVLEGNINVTSVDELSNGKGWLIKFSNGKSFTIKNGENGQDGRNGKNGEDGHTPAIGVKKDLDGLYYWTLDGNWILADGEKIRAGALDGTNGEDGYNGEDGKPGITPQLRIENGTWQMSLDNGDTWEDVDADGEYVVFKYVDISDPAYVTLVLQDGTELKLIRYAGAVKSIVAVPYYSDGSLLLREGENKFNFKVFPPEAAGLVAALPVDRFRLSAVYTLMTRASEGDRTTLPVTAVSNSEDEICLTVDASAIDPKVYSGDFSLNASLSICDDAIRVSSRSFALHCFYKKGAAQVNAGAGRPGNSCGWVQLWEDGPKFAEFNVGATITNYGMLDDGTDPVNGNIQYYNTANVGGLYPRLNPWINGRFTEWDPSVETGICDIATYLWGGCWRTPTDEEWDMLVDGVQYGGGTGTNLELVWTYCDGSSIQYCPGCTLKGYKVSGKAGSEYEYNCIFIPLAGWYDFYEKQPKDTGISAYYWASPTSYTGGTCDEYDFPDDSPWGLESFSDPYGNSVRAVYDESERTRGVASVSGTAGRPADVCGWVQLWEGGPKFAEFNVGATITNYGMLDNGTDPVNGNIQYYNTANIGGLYPRLNPYINGRFTDWYWDSGVETGICDIATALWGDCWRTPTDEEWDLLVDGVQNGGGTGTNIGLVWTYCDGSSIQYCPGCTLKGYKVSGKAGSEYEYNCIFIPLAGFYAFNAAQPKGTGITAYYWASPTAYTGGASDEYSFPESVPWGLDSYSNLYGNSVRAVMAE